MDIHSEKLCVGMYMKCAVTHTREGRYVYMYMREGMYVYMCIGEGMYAYMYMGDRCIHGGERTDL
jgi:hypothetical protein